jgi:hypothetical protein
MKTPGFGRSCPISSEPVGLSHLWCGLKRWDKSARSGTTSDLGQMLDGRIGVVGLLANNASLYSAGGLDRDPRQIGTWEVLAMSSGMAAPRSRTHNMLWLCHISDMDIGYAECRCAGGGRPVAAHRAKGTPDYGDAGIYREGHRASSKARSRRDATCPREVASDGSAVAAADIRLPGFRRGRSVVVDPHTRFRDLLGIMDTLSCSPRNKRGTLRVKFRTPFLEFSERHSVDAFR